MTTAAPTPPRASPPCNLLSVLWLQARALFERLARFPGDYVRRIPALEALVRAYVCDAANDRLVADSALRLRLTEAALKLKARLADMASAARRPTPSPQARPPQPGQPQPGPPQSGPPQPAAIPRRLCAPGFNPFPSPRALRASAYDGFGDPAWMYPRPERPSRPRARPSLMTTPSRDVTCDPAPDPASDRTSVLLRRPGRVDPVLACFANPEPRLAAIARVLADPEPAIRRAMRIIAARWEDHTMRLPRPEPDPADNMPGDQAHIAHPRPQLVAARDRPDFEIFSIHEFNAEGRLVEIPIDDDS